MPSSAAPAAARPTDYAFLPSPTEKWLTAAAIWALCLVTFSLPERQAPKQLGSLDLLALAKLGIRAGALGAFLFAWRWNPDAAAKRRIVGVFAPALAFLGWAWLSVLWSPLKTVSLGQALGLSALVMLAAWVALACRGRQAATFALTHLWAAVLVFTLALLAVHAAYPELSGLTRELDIAGERGFVRPTAAGSTAGLGFLLTLLLAKTAPGFRFRGLYWPALAAHGGMLLIANSRTAWAMTAAVTLLALARLYPTRAHAKIMTAACFAACAYLVVDPGFRLQEERLRDSSEYLSRGQTQSQLSGVSGRMELWTAIGKQIPLAPIIGHGYFVTSHDGKLNAWGDATNHTAHNLALQVVVSTGAVGAVLFVAAGLRLLLRVSTLARGDAQARDTFALVALLAIWYAGWSQMCISFLGPVLPESVVFFVVLGLAVGQSTRLASLRRAPAVAVRGPAVAPST